MCGIVGIISFDSDDRSFQHITAMNRALAHRGPDDEGIVFFSGSNSDPSIFGGTATLKSVYGSQYKYCPSKPFSNDIPPQTKIALGHRRLSIFDLSAAGHQPMCTEDGRYWIVYNGEIYNFKEIRNDLINEGEHFHSETDTEVLLKAYRSWGHKCLSYLNGMWAFVIYDRINNSIFISRDRFGKKPLYYYADRSCFIFASEIKAILKVPLVKTGPEIHNCISYIENGCQEIGRSTTFQNIFRFSPRAYAELSLAEIANRTIQEKKFWGLVSNPSSETFNEKQAKKYSEVYYNLLLDAVRIRLRADVKVGSALSGGLDSSSIVFLTNQLLRAKRKDSKQITFSSVYKSKQVCYCDESTYIDMLAEFLNVNAKQIEPRSEDISTEHRRMIYAMDTPPEGTLMSSWHTYKCAHFNNVKVTLDGQGADEQLAGYLSYIITYLSNCENGVLKEALHLAQIPGAKKIIPTGLLLHFGKRFLKKDVFGIALKLVGRKRNPYETLNGRCVEDTLGNLITLIHFADRASMAHSVESRMPFMDYRLVEYLASIPASYKIYGGWTKFIARLAMDKKLPDEITWRRDKMGWPIPHKYWFQYPLKNWFYRVLTDSNFLRQLGYPIKIRKHIPGRKNLDKLIRLLNLAIWHDVFFNSQR